MTYFCKFTNSHTANLHSAEKDFPAASKQHRRFAHYREVYNTCRNQKHTSGSECAEIPHSLSLCMYTFYPECLDIDALDTHRRPRWGPTGRERRRFQGNIPSTAAAGWPCVKTLSTSCMCSQKPFAVWGLIIFWVKPLN